MAEPSTPKTAKTSGKAIPDLLSSWTEGKPEVIARLRFRARPEDPVTEAPVTSAPLRFWQAAREWDSRMRNRNRWIGDETLCGEVAALARDRLKDWQIDEKTIVAFARAGVIEVLEEKRAEAEVESKNPWIEAGPAAPFPGGWVGAVMKAVTLSSAWLQVAVKSLRGQPRRMPWESFLVMAAQKYQNHEKLLVYRRIPGIEGRSYDCKAEKPAGLFVESAPGALWGVYEFDCEFNAVDSYLKNVSVERKQNLTLQELAAYIRSASPAIIHVSGIDGYQGFSILKDQDSDEGEPDPDPPPKSVDPAGSAAPVRAAKLPPKVPKDGVYFRDESGEAKVESPEAVARALCSGEKNKPLLVTLNLYNSSARLASEIVTNGAAAAVGFQDFIDDTVCEIFYANLFRAWSEKPGTSLLRAFQDAVKELHPYTDKVRGTGVTLWTSENLLEKADALCLPAPAGGSKRARAAKPSGVKLEFDIATFPQLNYSVLHNGKNKMFETFRVYRFGGGEDTDVRVEITLNAGGHNFSFRESYAMKHHILDLTEKIAVGLTSSLSRSLRESVRTTIFVRITLGPDEERYCKTFDVSLLAVDEWIDDSFSGIFLPSFVLPRDPVIPQIIARAQGYLMAIADDAAQGFDGYQSCDGNEDPAAALEPQTRAIWYALQHDFAIKYINPPPTFTESSQRLRTPSDTLKQGRGTCIDLALLLAACYEHIGLDPVVFLLSGHAFAGYWADEERRKEFRKTKYDPLNDPAIVDRKATALSLLSQNPEDFLIAETAPPVVWKYDSKRRAEIQAAVQNGELVAVEATYLTNGGSFASACDTGQSNLDPGEEFDSMLDISLARENGVTPLPLRAEEGPYS